MKTLYFLWDDRAACEDTDDAICITVSPTLNEAKKDQRQFGGVIFETIVEGNEIIEEKLLQ